MDDGPDEVWHALESVGDYRRWWPWLRRFDARALAPGERWQARIRVPLPWALRFELHLDDVVAPARIDATLTGDIEGEATITVAPSAAGAVIRLQSELAPRHRLLRIVNLVAPPVSRRLHDRVVDEAFRQFADRDRSVGGGRR